MALAPKTARSQPVSPQFAGSARRPAAGGKNFGSSPIHFACLLIARALLLFTLSYVVWRFGGTDTVTLWHTVLLLLLVTGFGFLGQARFGFKSKPIPIWIFLVGVVAVAAPAFQLVPLPPWLFHTLASGSERINQEIVEPPLRAIESLTPDSRIESPSLTNRNTISVVTTLTKSRLGQWSLMGAFVVLFALLFDTRGSRKVFLWTLSINAVTLSFWGLIQRSTGTTDLLPGLSKPSVILPFATFIYKNAGAAALVPGFAAAVALLWAIWLTPPRRNNLKKAPSGPSKSSRHSEYGRTPWWVQPRTLLLLVIAGTIAAGLLISFSRGAWMAMVVSGIAIFHVARRYFSFRTIILSLGLPVIACTALIATTSLFDKVGERFEQVSAEDVYADGRWEHWKEGIRTANEYLALGSGLGTYGYATLADQQRNSNLWFREAHNQYLETVAEQGVPGILIAIVGFVLFVRYSIRLLNHPLSREQSSIGFLGLFTITAIATQSTIDFVILIPGVMFLIAAVIGVVSQASVASVTPKGPRTLSSRPRLSTGQLRPRHEGETRSWPSTPASWIDTPVAWLATPVAWLATTFLLLLLNQSSYHSQLMAEQVAESTRIPAEDYQPTREEVEANIEQLTQCLMDTGDRADLYQRRSHWQFIKFRIELQQATEASGTSMSWESTSPDILFQTLMSLPMPQRKLIVNDLVSTTALREPLDATLQDLGKSIAINPFIPQLYLQATLIAPLTQVDYRPFLDNFIRLSHNNARFQFSAGLIAYHIDESDLMLDQWTQSLRTTTPEFAQMVQLTRRRVDLAETISRLVPEDRMELMLPMIKSLSHEDIVKIRSDEKWFELIQTRMESDGTLTTGRRQAYLANIAEELERHELAVSHWKSAVEAEGRNVDFRFRYSQSLLKQGDFSGAIKQSSLGQSLEPGSERFQSIAETARKRAAATKSMNRP